LAYFSAGKLLGIVRGGLFKRLVDAAAAGEDGY